MVIEHVVNYQLTHAAANCSNYIIENLQTNTSMAFRWAPEQTKEEITTDNWTNYNRTYINMTNYKFCVNGVKIISKLDLDIKISLYTESDSDSDSLYMIFNYCITHDKLYQ